MKIAKLEPSKRVQDRWLLFLEDGSILRVGKNEMADFALHAGMELTEELAEALQNASQAGALKDKALDLLALRPMSRRELIKKLTARKKDGTAPDEEQAQAVCDRLEELGLLNDEAYAKTVAEHYSAKGYGPRKVQDELFRRGVPREFWSGAMEETDRPDDAIDAFLLSKLKGRTPDRAELKKVSDALARRGYRWPDISAGLRRYGAEINED